MVKLTVSKTVPEHSRKIGIVNVKKKETYKDYKKNRN